MTIDEILDSIYPLPQASKDMLVACITFVSFPKKHILLSAAKVANNIYFIKKGIARAYAYHEDNEITFWFGKEGDTIISMKSYVAQQKSYEDVELLEDCELYELNTAKLQKLFESDIHIANWGRKFAELELVKTEERLLSRQVRTASQRYADLLKHSPELVQRVQLGYLSSYLGITQVSLSRIRAEIK